MSDNPSEATVLTAVNHLATALENDRAERRRTARVSTLLKLALLCVVVTFAVANVLYFRSAWSAEKFKEHLKVEMEEISPVAMRELSGMTRSLVPVYVQEGRAQLSKRGPEIREVLEHEIGILGYELTQRFHEKMAGSMHVVTTQAREELVKAWPDLEEPARQAELRDRFMKTLEKAVLDAALTFQNRFDEDVQSFVDTVSGFQVENPDQDPSELKRKFIRLWLRLLDQEVQKL